MNESFDVMEEHLQRAIDRSVGMPERLDHLQKALDAVQSMRRAEETGELSPTLRRSLLYKVITHSADSGAFRGELIS